MILTPPRPAFRPDVESLDDRFMPAFLSLSVPVSAALAVHVGAPACSTPVVDANVSIRVGVNLTTCAPAYCAPAPCYTPPSCTPCTPAPVCGTGLLTGLTAKVGQAVVGVGSLVYQVAGQAAVDIGTAGAIVDSLVTGCHTAPRYC